MKNRLISLMSIVVLASLTIEPLICFSNATNVQTEHQRQEQEQKQQQFDDNPDIQETNNKYQTGTTRRRSTVNENTCTAESVCNDNESFSIMLTPTTAPAPAPAPPTSSPLSSVNRDDNENKGIFSTLMNRLTRFISNNNNLFSRLMNGLFNAFQQNNKNDSDDSKYMFPTNTIVTSLSKYSNKLKNLTNLINDEMETLSSSNSSTNRTSSNATKLIYSISIGNLNALNTVLDSILFEFNQQETMNVQTISCYLLQFVTYMHNTTVPNIESMTQILYTKTSNDNMKSMWNQYSSSSSRSSSTTGTSLASSSTTMGNRNTSTSSPSSTIPLRTTTNKYSQDHCTDVTKSVARQDESRKGKLLDFILGESSTYTTPSEHIIKIGLLIIVFPLSIVVSILGTIVFVIVIIWILINGENLPTADDYLTALFLLPFYAAPIAPLLVIFFIIRNVVGLFVDILDPLIPDNPPTLAATYPFQNLPNTSSTSTKNKSSSSSSSSPLLEAASDVKNQLSLVLLDSPLQSILNILKDSTTYTDQYINDDELDCDSMILSCQNDALFNALPF